jgi:acetolactate synthase-1/2/3 large subunit
MSYSRISPKEALPPLREPRRNGATLADLLLSYLQELGVEYVFGIPGGAIEPLYSALARSERRRSGGPVAVVARHEAGAAFMADGYSRATGRIGVCCATTGPGATNLITGVASAYENQVPLLIITAQTATGGFGQGAFQESSDTGINIVGMLQHCTAYSSLVSHASQFEHKLATALTIALAQQRPVHLSLPLDIFKAPAPPQLWANIPSLLRTRTLYCEGEADTVAACLLASRKPLFIIGRQCRDAMADVLAAAERIGAYLITTPDAKFLVDPYHPLYRGVIGFAGHSCATDMLRDTTLDTILLLGTTLSEWGGRRLIQQSAQEKWILVNADSLFLSRAPGARLHIQGSIKAIFARVNTLLNTAPSTGGLPGSAPRKLPFKTLDYSLADNWLKARVKPQWLMSQLPLNVPAGTQYLADTGNSTAWAVHYLQLEHRVSAESRKLVADSCLFADAFLHVTIEFAAMGWAIGAAVGIALACRKRPVVCITGDGSCLMNGQEITVARQYGLPLILIILNDGHLGMVNHGQRLTGAETIGTRLPAVDFAQMATAMGIAAHNIRCPEDWYRLNLKSSWDRATPLVLNVWVDAEEVPPIGLRTDLLANDGEEI